MVVLAVLVVVVAVLVVVVVMVLFEAKPVAAAVVVVVVASASVGATAWCSQDCYLYSRYVITPDPCRSHGRVTGGISERLKGSMFAIYRLSIEESRNLKGSGFYRRKYHYCRVGILPQKVLLLIVFLNRVSQYNCTIARNPILIIKASSFT